MSKEVPRVCMGLDSIRHEGGVGTMEFNIEIRIVFSFTDSPFELFIALSAMNALLNYGKEALASIFHYNNFETSRTPRIAKFSFFILEL
jgi:hypothetical protein